MSAGVEIACGVCVLRPWRVGDEVALVRHANSREIWLNLRDHFPHPYTAADAVDQVRLGAVRRRRSTWGGGGGVASAPRRRRARLGARHLSAAVRAFTRYVFQQFSLTRVFRRPLRNQHRVAAGARESWLRARGDTQAERHQGRQGARSSAVRCHRPRSRSPGA